MISIRLFLSFVFLLYFTTMSANIVLLYFHHFAAPLLAAPAPSEATKPNSLRFPHPPICCPALRAPPIQICYILLPYFIIHWHSIEALWAAWTDGEGGKS